MALPRFYHPAGGTSGDDIVLSMRESQHARESRRLVKGAQVSVFDGRGWEGLGRITARDGIAVVVNLEQVERVDRPHRQLTLAVCTPKGSRADLLIEKCTELGISAIWPMNCERSVVRPRVTKLEKWRQLSIETCKQCHRSWVPNIREVGSFSSVLDEAAEFSHTLIAEGDGLPLREYEFGTGANILLLVGPEGGFTDAELAQANALKFQCANLSAQILRIETAAMAATALIMAH